MMILGKTVEMSEDGHVKAVVWLGGLLFVAVGCISGLLWAEDRYQHKKDAEQELARLAAAQTIEINVLRGEVKSVNVAVEYNTDKNSKRYIEDQLFKLEQISPNRLTDSERAQIAKYRRDLRQLIDHWNSKGTPLR